jgi:hypothetical protein
MNPRDMFVLTSGKCAGIVMLSYHANRTCHWAVLLHDIMGQAGVGRTGNIYALVIRKR